MFTRRELLEAIPRLVEAAPPPMQAVEFDQYAFESPASEQTIWAFRGAKADFSSAALFWVKTLQAQGWEGRADRFVPYAETALCTPLTEADFFRLVADFGCSLRQPIPEYLAPRPGFVAALKMYGEWNDVAAVAEFAEAFVAFYWCTTA
jgi:hypothetical protein